MLQFVRPEAIAAKSEFVIQAWVVRRGFQEFAKRLKLFIDVVHKSRGAVRPTTELTRARGSDNLKKKMLVAKRAIAPRVQRFVIWRPTASVTRLRRSPRG